jgi:hypothetical protein
MNADETASARVRVACVSANQGLGGSAAVDAPAMARHVSSLNRFFAWFAARRLAAARRAVSSRQ